MVKTRPDTRDSEALLEAKMYGALEFRPNDVALDLGGNIGAFGRLAVDAGARVIAVEPEPFNAKMYADNVPEASVIRAAVAADDAGRKLYVRNSTSHTIVRGRGREGKSIPVNSVTLPTLIREHDPTVLKVDIEGAEYEVDWTCLRQSRVRELAIEFHGNSDQKLEQMNAVSRSLEEMGFSVVKSVETGAWGGYFVNIMSRVRKVESKPMVPKRRGRPPKQAAPKYPVPSPLLPCATAGVLAGITLGWVLGPWAYAVAAAMVALAVAFEAGRRLPNV